MKNIETKTIEFHIEDEAIIILKKDKFYFKGHEVNDANKVYERFKEWLTLAEKKGNFVIKTCNGE